MAGIHLLKYMVCTLGYCCILHKRTTGILLHNFFLGVRSVSNALITVDGMWSKASLPYKAQRQPIGCQR